MPVLGHAEGDEFALPSDASRFAPSRENPFREFDSRHREHSEHSGTRYPRQSHKDGVSLRDFKGFRRFPGRSTSSADRPWG